MADLAQSQSLIRFAGFEVDLSSGELRKNGVRIRLPEQSFQILVMLVLHSGKVVSREDLRKKLWPSDTYVDFDAGLNSAILRLRNALGDSAETPRFVETLPKRGYRFIAQVDTVPRTEQSPTAETAAGPIQKSTSSRQRNVKLAVAMLVLAVVLITTIGLNVGRVRERLLSRRTPLRIQSVAVLPLENLTGDPTQEYFADGMTDALITDLAQISALRVISRTSAMQYKAAKKPLKQIARELDVDAIVEGTVVRSGDRVRIDAQLIEAATDQHLWAKSYERDIRDIVALQAEVAQSIANEIQIRTTPQEKARLATARPVNPVAYEAYLKGIFYANKRTEDSIRKSTAYFEQAVGSDPQDAPAFAGLAGAYVLLGFFGAASPQEAYPKAKVAAAKALVLDESLAPAHEALAGTKLWYDWDWEGAERQYKRALELNPGYAPAHQHYGNYLAAMGKSEQSIAEAKRALELDPLSLTMNTHLGFMLYLARQADLSIAQYKKTLELDPNHARALRDLSMVYAGKGMYREALVAGEKAIDRSEASPLMIATLAYAYGASGDSTKGRALLSQLQQLSKQRYVSPFYVALACAGLGNRDEAFGWLEKAYQERSSQLVWLRVHPMLDSLRSDPRFDDLIRRVGLPENDRQR